MHDHDVDQSGSTELVNTGLFRIGSRKSQGKKRISNGYVKNSSDKFISNNLIRRNSISKNNPGLTRNLDQIGTEPTSMKSSSTMDYVRGQ